jgi:hypothetical protein
MPVHDNVPSLCYLLAGKHQQAPEYLNAPGPGLHVYLNMVVSMLSACLAGERETKLQRVEAWGVIAQLRLQCCSTMFTNFVDDVPTWLTMFYNVCDDVLQLCLTIVTTLC